MEDEYRDICIYRCMKNILENVNTTCYDWRRFIMTYILDASEILC